MDGRKIQKTFMIAIFVSIAAQIHIDFLTEGFIVAMSSVVMAIFIYCYEDLTAAYIVCLSGVFSPLIRLLIDLFSGDPVRHALVTVLPDVIFFFAYGAVYTLMYRFVIRDPKSMKNFPYAVFFSDLLANVMEMLLRSLLAGSFLLTPTVIAYLALIALVRTVIIMMVVLAIEAYGNLLIHQERDREYRRLLTQASIIEGEVRLMNKNVSDVEAVMKDAYELYYTIKDQGYPKEVVDSVLELARNTHEIKGDYQNVLGILNEIFPEGLEKERLTIGEIISLERSNVLAMARRNGYQVEITSRVQADFMTRKPFRMMAVIRNLMTNAAEAISTGPGSIIVTVTGEVDDLKDPFGKASRYRITVRDNGPGIPPEEIGNLFLAGYSTKFDPKTGNIQRGLGLCLVKDYVENDFGGRLEVESSPGEFTEFRLTIPAGNI
ncbi:MAG: hypothetical protein IJ109_07620 [Firmicutes bacterium]|nr:hypothetical protein [Bacillota bacterium]